MIDILPGYKILAEQKTIYSRSNLRHFVELISEDESQCSSKLMNWSPGTIVLREGLVMLDIVMVVVVKVVLT